MRLLTVRDPVNSHNMRRLCRAVVDHDVGRADQGLDPHGRVQRAAPRLLAARHDRGDDDGRAWVGSALAGGGLIESWL